MNIATNENREQVEKLRGCIQANSALSELSTLKQVFFSLYQRTHEDGFLTRYLSLTEPSVAVLCSNDWSGMSDKMVWDKIDDALDDLEMLELLRALLPG